MDDAPIGPARGSPRHTTQRSRRPATRPEIIALKFATPFGLPMVALFGTHRDAVHVSPDDSQLHRRVSVLRRALSAMV